MLGSLVTLTRLFAEFMSLRARLIPQVVFSWADVAFSNSPATALHVALVSEVSVLLAPGILPARWCGKHLPPALLPEPCAV